MTHRKGFRDFLRSLTGRAPEPTTPAVTAPAPLPPAAPVLPSEVVIRYGVVIRRSDYVYQNFGLFDDMLSGPRTVFAVKPDGDEGGKFRTINVSAGGRASLIREGDHVKMTHCGRTEYIEVDWEGQQAAKSW
jgi:hypothetical protein